MKPMSSTEIRRAFLDFFVEQGHTEVASSSLVPVRDPTLLFANAGMVQFKDVFLGMEKRAYVRATTSQKCMRVSGKHNDLENVGPSTRHHTFFEMLGNFSFGDYFKREAIGYAWTFLTDRLGMDPARLYPTIYLDDDEAFGLWQDVAGVPADTITRLGKKDNFWSMGDVGPCGPCSEIIYDRGEEYCTCGQADCGPACECDRWWEIWNLVFMQFESLADGSMVPLPRPSIDTGMGLERLTAILQGHGSNYRTDLFMPIIRRTQELLGHSDAYREEHIVSYRVIADHGRAITFLVGDGVMPGNEGRSYVLRLILRRAARYGKMLGFEKPFLTDVARVVIDQMGEHYTELRSRQDFILRVIEQEETRFLQTLSTGLALLDSLMAELRAAGQMQIAGSDAFRLYDTYGFPLDLTRDVAMENGFTIDEAGFAGAMAAQRERARAAQQFVSIDAGNAETYLALKEQLREQGDLETGGVSHVYDVALDVETRVIGLIADGSPVESVSEGDSVQAVLPVTPFYVEGGGQTTDVGIIAHYDGTSSEPVWQMEVTEAHQPVAGLIVHAGKVTRGTPRVGDSVWAGVDAERRLATARNHTATHLLQHALRQVLGAHVQQAGSLVTPDRLRFDFTHSGMLSRDELSQVELLVNRHILAGYPVRAEWSDYRAALNRGVIALFDEKYGDRVRVIQVGRDGQPLSQELCGGTHVDNTAVIGSFFIVSEASIGSGIRRIEAVTGQAAHRLARRRMALLEDVATTLSTTPDEVDRRAHELLEEMHSLGREIVTLRRSAAKDEISVLLESVTSIGDVQVLTGLTGSAGDMETLREMTDWLRDRLGSAVVVLGAEIEGKPNLVVAVTQDLVERGLHAGHIVKAAAKEIRGGGGGRPTLAQAGGSDASRLPQALEAVHTWVRQNLGEA
jgi:alanyl-tRNA synthetase